MFVAHPMETGMFLFLPNFLYLKALLYINSFSIRNLVNFSFSFLRISLVIGFSHQLVMVISILYVKLFRLKIIISPFARQDRERRREEAAG